MLCKDKTTNGYSFPHNYLSISNDGHIFPHTYHKYNNGESLFRKLFRSWDKLLRGRTFRPACRILVSKLGPCTQGFLELLLGKRNLQQWTLRISRIYFCETGQKVKQKAKAKLLWLASKRRTLWKYWSFLKLFSKVFLFGSKGYWVAICQESPLDLCVALDWCLDLSHQQDAVLGYSWCHDSLLWSAFLWLDANTSTFRSTQQHDVEESFLWCPACSDIWSKLRDNRWPLQLLGSRPSVVVSNLLCPNNRYLLHVGKGKSKEMLCRPKQLHGLAVTAIYFWRWVLPHTCRAV